MWWLIRGTLQPPVLSQDHPVRRIFYRHGKSAAQHWLVTLLVSVAIAMGFSYPTMFLSENPTAGVSAQPHPVWTTAKTFDGAPEQFDLEMRQVWIHGSYMQALQKDVLRTALHIQQALVGGNEQIHPLAESLRSHGISWGYHSPLLYWNSSERLIDLDPDLLDTIHAKSRSSSSLNVALRPASVFAGKRFDRNRLKAADAIVITLVNKLDDGAKQRWESEMHALTSGVCQNCTLFPGDGNVTRHRVYEFSFTPMSTQEIIVLTLAYACMVFYVLVSLHRMKAFHSRFGLVVTAITQMTCSILSSITICGLLKINLSTIPQMAYPFVVLVMGLEAMFRLINAINKTPATMATDLRIASALGDIGPGSAATAAQNVLILTVLSRFLSPGVAAFCAFACIATMFDAFFLFTFFVAVLNVDIKRLELQDAISRTKQVQAKRRAAPSRANSWFEALISGRLPISTSMAGTAVTTTFILSLNYHFFQRHEKTGGLRHLLGLVAGGQRDVADFDTFTPPPINATLTPSEWMRMQDFETAREIMQLAKPGADSFIIRVFAPQIVVLAGSDRTGAPAGTDEWTQALRAFTAHHFYPVAVAIIFIVTFVAVLMNFLLYREPKGDEEVANVRGNDAVEIHPLDLPHRLDIVKLFGHERGHLVTIGLDRSIAISTFDQSKLSHSIASIPTSNLTAISWPIHSACIDQSGVWTAYHCGDNRVLFYNVSDGAFVHSMAYPDDNPPILFAFTHLMHGEEPVIHFLVLTSGGRLSACSMSSGESRMWTLSRLPLLGATVLKASTQGRRIVAVNDQARILSFEWTAGEWNEVVSKDLGLAHSTERLYEPVCIQRQEDMNNDIVTVATRRAVVFLEGQSLVPIGRLNLDRDRDVDGPVLLGQAVTCANCGSVAYRSISTTMATETHEECQLLSLYPGGGDDAALCVRKGTDECMAFTHARQTTENCLNAGSWFPCRLQVVLGLRRQPNPGATSDQNYDIRPSSHGVRQRRQPKSAAQPGSATAQSWEAYRLSPGNNFETCDMPLDEQSGNSLYVHRAGPAVPLGPQAVAIAFGNNVKIIRASRRHQ